MQKIKTIWFFGLSGSGKTTLSTVFSDMIDKDGRKSFLLDGDVIRKGVSNNLGFNKNDRAENVRRIAEICKILITVEIIPIVAAITPYKSNRDKIIEILGRDNLTLIYVDCSLEECEKRDPKNLYQKARMGEIKNFTGISDGFETPSASEYNFRIKTENKSIQQSEIELAELFNKL
ncbi:adenylyl-sulfate kinase [Flagellimonas meridianipacifica]|uniref:Adenylyl-sulfate kinase n=1 Tax=Flagellimonas meridianipacifica TaxID=1080225 RepID=A0A2T0MCN7_9FLAO|nr:adenylyl-sulfate kinase [Allomuricauda pacifica]PRX55252.1 adenylylsulfate kinase [Allomuricauda pacifica]